MISRISLETAGKGLYDVTHKVRQTIVNDEVDEAMVTVFLRHTSASLIIQENADPCVQNDLQAWLERLVPEGDPLYTHTTEGPDDMPAHVKAALTQTHVCIPLVASELALGTWQGIYVWEHREAPHTRELLVSLVAVL